MIHTLFYQTSKYFQSSKHLHKNLSVAVNIFLFVIGCSRRNIYIFYSLFHISQLYVTQFTILVTPLFISIIVEEY